eukprot:ANDGO_06339.mRNA.1 Intraflagellar transport protein 81
MYGSAYTSAYTASTVQGVISLLKDHLSLDLSLFQLDEKSPIELLGLFHSILQVIDSALPAFPFSPGASASITLEEYAGRTTDYLIRFMNYKEFQDPGVLSQALSKADRNVLYPLMLWLLQKLPDLRKRVYLARFLMPVDMPEEFLMDPAIDDENNKLHALQEEFKAVHKVVDKNRSTKVSPAELRAKISGLEQEKEQLENKVARLKSKIEDLEGASSLVDRAQSLRKAYDEYARLGISYREQQRLLLQAEADLEDATAQLKSRASSHGSSEEEDIDAVLAKMQAENHQRSSLLMERLPLQLQQMQERFESLSRIERDQTDPRKLESDVRRLKDRVNVLEQRSSGSVSIVASNAAKQNERKDMSEEEIKRVEMFRQQLTLVQKKRTELESEAARMREQVQQAENQSRGTPSKRSSGSHAAASPKAVASPKQSSAPKEEDIHAYVAQMRNKSAIYKKKKAELGVFQTENGVLSRTVDILKSRDTKLNEYLDEVASKKGVQGFQHVREDLDRVSAQKATLDESKGQTLEEISRVVEEINAQIRNKKQQLQPQIKELQALRDEHRELQTKHSDKKRDFEAAIAGAETEKLMAEQDVLALTEDYRQQESLFHLLQSQTAMVKAWEDRARKELEYKSSHGSSNLNSEHSTYEEMLMAQAQQLQQQSRELQERQRYIKENLEPNRMQMQWLGRLESLLEAKRRYYDEQAVGHVAPQAQGSQLVLGVDRLVL